ncbi:MAG: hypothetical protein BMS9Abin29_2640 [Gemmatimonadota bacterium]|nr:MAG: hypothetical protein BMS9Abin29_2640 [Gemmatimonadota bacterium]
MPRTIAIFGGVLLAFSTLALTPGEADSQAVPHITRCRECARQLGGREIAGPYPSKPQCEAARRIMRSQGFPFLPCVPAGAGGGGAAVRYGGPGASMGIKTTALSIILGGLGGGLGWATGSEADQDLNIRKGAVIGGAVGWVIGLAMQQPDTPKGEQPLDAILAGGSAATVAYFAVDTYSNKPPEEKKRDAAVAAMGAMAVGVVASFTMGKKLNSGFRTGDTGRGWLSRVGLSIAPTFWPDQGVGWATVVTVRW